MVFKCIPFVKLSNFISNGKLKRLISSYNKFGILIEISNYCVKENSCYINLNSYKTKYTIQLKKVTVSTYYGGCGEGFLLL